MVYDSQECRERIVGKATPLDIAINKIVDEHIGNLDEIINNIKNMLHDETNILTDIEIEDIMLQLPILLYDVTDNQEIVGMQSDLATQLYRESYNEALKLARGTVAEKTAISELATMTEKLDTVIFDRAYKIIKQKILMATEILNAVKKIQSVRQQRYELNGRFTSKI